MDRQYREFYRHHCKKIAVLTAFFALFASISASFLGSNAPAAEASAGYSYAVIDAQTMKVIEKHDENLRKPMASTTKIMTALLVAENCNLRETVMITDEMTNVEGSSVYLRAGERLTVKELLYCLMLRSGNDSAKALAIHASGSTERFAEMMNIRAESMGLADTHFVNPHGLHDDDHYTTASDLASISAIAIRNPIFREIVSTKRITVGKDDSKRILQNKNKLLSLYPHSIGIKTGYTKKAGRCLVSAAEKDGHTLVCVVLNYGDTYGLSMRLLEQGFRDIRCVKR